MKGSILPARMMVLLDMVNDMGVVVGKEGFRCSERFATDVFPADRTDTSRCVHTLAEPGTRCQVDTKEHEMTRDGGNVISVDQVRKGTHIYGVVLIVRKG